LLKTFFNIRNPFASDNWESNDYVSPDGSRIRIQSFSSKSFNFIGKERSGILSGRNEPFDMFESMPNRIDETFNNAFKDVSGTFSRMENQLENAFGEPRINPKLILSNNYETEIQPRFEENISRVELDRSLVYLLIAMAAMLLILSVILTALTYFYRKRSRLQQEVIVPMEFDAPPTYDSASQAIVKMTNELEPLKIGTLLESPPPYKK